MIKAIVDHNTILQFAEFRRTMHRRQGTPHREFSEDYEEIGMVGEAAFAKAYNLPMDLRLLLSGDRGYDFETPAGTIDIKTFRKAFNLIVEKEKVVADIYVLARYDDENQAAKMIGWEYGDALKKCPVRDFGYGVINHYKSARNLRNMSDLWLLLKGGSNGLGAN